MSTGDTARYRDPVTFTDAALERFWAEARSAHTSLPRELPEAWAFGATPEHADDLLALVLAGTKTGTASALADYGADGEDAEPLPAVGDLSIVLDGADVPRAVLEVTAIDIAAFDEVTAEHARAEGEDDRTLASWRRIHEDFWTAHAARGFAPDMPVVCERFRVLYAEPPRRP
ncbi:hypothetical protein GCM10009625_24590 [Brachybacterium fresconis]